MINLRIGKKTYEWKFISWADGSALVSVKQDQPVAETSPAERKIIAARPDEKILRQFPPRVAPAAVDRRRLSWNE